MRFFTSEEARGWCAQHGIALDARGVPDRSRNGDSRLAVNFPRSIAHLVPFCRLIERALQPRETCLLWVTLSSVWPSSENLHLYYRLRQSYGDTRLIAEAPAHLFLTHETHDFLSFLEVGVTSGWDIHLIPTVGYASAFISHDEWAEFSFENLSDSVSLRGEAGEFGLEIREA
jgi:hypothetical protein